MTNLKTYLQVNPIIVKELRSRMRGGRAFITLTVTLLLTAGLMYALLQVMLSVSQYSYDVVSPRIGQALFTVLAYLELMIICAITPAVTAGAISGEREKQTYEMLQATPLSPSSLLWGKLFSALSYVFLLLFAGIPLASIIFIFGGVSPSDMFKALLVLLALAVAFGVLGLFMSALFARTGRATVASFLVVLALNFVPLVVAAVLAITQQGNMPRNVLVFSPISILAGVLAPFNTSYGGPLDILPIISGYAFRSAVTPVSMISIPRPTYHYGLAFYAALTVVLYLLAARLVRPSRRWKFTRAEAVRTAAVIVIFAGLMTAAYLYSAPRYEWNRPAVDAGTEPIIKPGFPMSEPAIPANQAANNVAINGPAQNLSAEDRAAIYAAVIDWLVKIDSGIPADETLSGVYVLSQADDSAGDPALAGQVAPEPFGPELQGAITDRLTGNLPAPLMWVDTPEGASRDPETDELSPGGLLVRAGIIYESTPDTMVLAGSVEQSGGRASGRQYVLARDQDGLWQVTGTTGAEWTN